MGMTRTGPNDTSGIIWAIGEFIFISFAFLYKLTNVLYTYSLNLLVIWQGRHLRVPRFGAYKPPRSDGPVPVDKPWFLLFPLPTKSSWESSSLVLKFKKIPAISSLLPDTGYEKPLRLIPSTIQLSTWLPHPLTVVLPPFASLPRTLPPLSFIPLAVLANEVLYLHISILLHPLSHCIGILRLLWNQIMHVDRLNIPLLVTN